MDLLNRLTATRTALRGWAVATLVSNIGIVVTGGIVRVTASGLGCPTWPRCFPDSYVATPESGIHGAIEFGNRLLTFVLAIIAIGMFVTAIRVTARNAAALPGPEAKAPRRRVLRTLAVLAALGIPLQAVVGGFSVLFQLNPYVVGLHMLLSVGLIAAAVGLVHEAYGIAPTPVSPLAARLVTGIWLLTGVVIVLGVLVTGAGPHAGDGGVRRNGLELESIARIHALSVWLLVALTIAALVMTRARALVWVLIVELAQGAIGYIQYFTALPAVLVVLHLLGSSAATAVATHAYLKLARGTKQSETPKPELVAQA